MSSDVGQKWLLTCGMSRASSMCLVCKDVRFPAETCHPVVFGAPFSSRCALLYFVLSHQSVSSSVTTVQHYLAIALLLRPFESAAIITTFEMGKRKSKINKQKQSKAANFGVSVVKKTKHGIMNVQPRVAHITVAKGPAHATTAKKWITAEPKSKRDDFDLEMKSLVERSMPVKKATHAIALAPATLLVHNSEKSTARLVHEAVESVQGGMAGIGQQLTTNPLHVVAARQRWTAPATGHETGTNPYSALDQHDGCDEDELPVLQKPLLFQFAPPSFALHSARRDDTDDDNDPDL
jgi:hypothetical protein